MPEKKHAETNKIRNYKRELNGWQKSCLVLISSG